MNLPDKQKLNIPKSIKTIPGKLSKEKELYKLARFTAVLAVAAIALTYLSSLNLEMKFARRQVATQTNTVLQATGVNSILYQHSARIPKDSPILPEAERKLTELGFREIPNNKTMQFLSKSLHPKKQEIYNAYIQNLKKQGNRVYNSPALIFIQGQGASSESFQVDIVPECVGWIGIFAVLALIIAYPDASNKERVLGAVLSIPLIHLMNIIRLSTTIHAGWSLGQQSLHLVHDVLWRTLLIAWALILWIIWIKYIVKE